MHALSRLRSYAASTVRMHGSALLAFGGALLAFGGYLAARVFDARYSFYFEVTEGVGVLIAAAGALIASMQQSKDSEELQQKNAEIIDLQKQISETLTGGDDFCFLDVLAAHDDPQQQEGRVLVMPPTKNPLYGVRIRYADTSTALAHGPKSAEALFRIVKRGMSFEAVGSAGYEKVYKFDDILPAGFFELRRVTITHIPFVIDARFYARNGQWHQSIMYERAEGGGIASASFVVRTEPKPCKLLLKRVTDNFPNKERIFVYTYKGKEKVSDIPFLCARGG